MQQQSGRTIMGSVKEIIAKGGIPSLYEGVFPMIGEAVVKVGMRYYVYAACKDMWKHHVQKEMDPNKPVSLAGNVFGGAMAGTLESFLVVIPAELLKVRHMTNPKHESFMVVARDTLRQDGLMGLYRGGGATWLRQVTNQVRFFPAFAEFFFFLRQTDADIITPQ
jgi:solute carrier family 25 (mitochondrial citrate transporter), member 1